MDRRHAPLFAWILLAGCTGLRDATPEGWTEDLADDLDDPDEGRRRKEEVDGR